MRLGLEYERRGVEPPRSIRAVTQEYRRRGLTPGYRNRQGFELSPEAVERRAEARYQQIEEDFAAPTDEQRDDFVRAAYGRRLDRLIEAKRRSAGYEGDRSTPLTFAERSDLYATLDPETEDEARRRIGERFDTAHTPGAALARRRQEIGDRLAEAYRADRPHADEQDVARHVQEELARGGYTPPEAGRMRPVVDEAGLEERLRRAGVLSEGPLVDRGYSLGGVGDAAAGGVRSVAQTIDSIYGSLALGGAATAAEELVGDDLGLRDLQAAVRETWRHRVMEGPWGPSRRKGAYGEYQRFAGTLGQVAGDLAQTVALSVAGAGAAQAAATSARIQRLVGTLSGMGLMGAKEGGGVYADVYDRLQALGYDRRTANGRALAAGAATGVVNALIERVPIETFAFRNAAEVDRLAGSLRGLVVEGGQEGVQEVVNVLSEFQAGAGGEDVINWDNAERILTAALAGGVVGAGAGAATGGRGVAGGREARDDAEAAGVAEYVSGIIDRARRQGRQRRGARGRGRRRPDRGREQRGGRRYPRIIATPRQLGRWYARTFDDRGGGDAIEALAATAGDGKGERFKLVDVPVGAIRTEGQTIDEARAGEMAGLAEGELPPVILVGGDADVRAGGAGGGGLSIADGAHRIAAAQRAGRATIRGYVPESVAKRIESGDLAPAAGSDPAETEGGDGGAVPPGRSGGRRAEPPPDRGGEGGGAARGRGPDVEPPRPGTTPPPGEGGRGKKRGGERVEATALATYLAANSADRGSPGDLEGERQYFEETLKATLLNGRGPFVRARVPLDRLEVPNEPEAEQVEAYAAQETAAPPIVAGRPAPDYDTGSGASGGLMVVDGAHRIAAARARGETEIEAYVPEADAQAQSEGARAPDDETGGDGDGGTRQDTGRGELTVEETDAARRDRINAGYTELVELDAVRFQAEHRERHGEPLAWDARRAAELAGTEPLTEYPRLYHDPVDGELRVQDGRHRIAEAARRGQTITVAVRPPDDYGQEGRGQGGRQAQEADEGETGGGERPGRPEGRPRQRGRDREGRDAGEAVAIAHWERFKSRYPETMVLIRRGDFYAAFGEDAEAARRTLGVRTSSARTREGLEMIGLPADRIEAYMSRLIEAGHRVAVAEPTSPSPDPESEPEPGGGRRAADAETRARRAGERLVRLLATPPDEGRDREGRIEAALERLGRYAEAEIDDLDELERRADLFDGLQQRIGDSGQRADREFAKLRDLAIDAYEYARRGREPRDEAEAGGEGERIREGETAAAGSLPESLHADTRVYNPQRLPLPERGGMGTEAYRRVLRDRARAEIDALGDWRPGQPVWNTPKAGPPSGEPGGNYEPGHEWYYHTGGRPATAERVIAEANAREPIGWKAPKARKTLVRRLRELERERGEQQETARRRYEALYRRGPAALLEQSPYDLTLGNSFDKNVITLWAGAIAGVRNQLSGSSAERAWARRRLEELEAGGEPRPPEAPPESSGGTGDADIEAQVRRGDAAMERVIAEHADVRAAMERPRIGSISFYWGDPGRFSETKGRWEGGSGISHIIAQRNAEAEDGEGVARRLPEVIARGEVGDVYGPEGGERLNITHHGHTAVLSLYRFGDRENWLLTGWKNGPGGEGGVNPAPASTPDPSGIRDRTAGSAETSVATESRRGARGPQGGLPGMERIAERAERYDPLVRPLVDLHAPESQAKRAELERLYTPVVRAALVAGRREGRRADPEDSPESLLDEAEDDFFGRGRLMDLPALEGASGDQQTEVLQQILLRGIDEGMATRRRRAAAPPDEAGGGRRAEDEARINAARQRWQREYGEVTEEQLEPAGTRYVADVDEEGRWEVVDTLNRDPSRPAYDRKAAEEQAEKLNQRPWPIDPPTDSPAPKPSPKAKVTVERRVDDVESVQHFLSNGLFISEGRVLGTDTEGDKYGVFAPGEGRGRPGRRVAKLVGSAGSMAEAMRIAAEYRPTREASTHPETRDAAQEQEQATEPGPQAAGEPEPPQAAGGERAGPAPPDDAGRSEQRPDTGVDSYTTGRNPRPIHELNPEDLGDAQTILAAYRKPRDAQGDPLGHGAWSRRSLRAISRALRRLDRHRREDLERADTAREDALVWLDPELPKPRRRKLLTRMETIAARKKQPTATRKKSSGRKKPTKPARARNDNSLRKQVMRAAAKTDRRTEINGLFIDEGGRRLTTTDGRRLLRLETPEPLGPAREGVYRVRKDGGVGERAENAQTPPLQKVIPEELGDASARTAEIGDLAAEVGRARRAAVMASDEARYVVMVLNEDGSLGYASATHGVGTAEVNVKEGYRTLGALRPLYLLDALEAAYAIGADTAELWFPSPNKPMALRASAGGSVGGSVGGSGRTLTSIVAPMEYEAGVERMREMENPRTMAKGPRTEPIEGLPGVGVRLRRRGGGVYEVESVEGEKVRVRRLRGRGPEEMALSETDLGRMFERVLPEGDAAAEGGLSDPGPELASPAGERGAGEPEGGEPEGGAAGRVPSGGWTRDYDPLGSREGRHRRLPRDRPARIRRQLAAARARRDGGEWTEADSVHRIISDLARRLNLGPPGLGRSPKFPRSAEGFYRPRPQAIRLRLGTGAHTMFHEVGHHLHQVLFPRARPKAGAVLSSQDLPRQWRKELAALGRRLYGERRPPAGYASEGWAEAVRMLIAEPKTLKRQAPGVHHDATTLLVERHPDTWLVLLDARTRLANAAAQAAENPVRQHVAHGPNLPKLNPGYVFNWLATRLSDRFHRVLAMERDLLGGRASGDASPHTLALRANGHISGDLKLAMERGTFDPGDPARRPTGPSLASILDPVRDDLDLWQDYMVARRALEKRGQGYANVLPDDPRSGRPTSDAALREFIRSAEAGHPAFREAAEGFQGFNRWLVGEYAVGYGLVTPEAAELIMARNLEYITFRHKKTEDALARTYGLRAAGRGFAGQSSGIRRFREGLGEQLFPPLESFMVSMQGIVSRARLNEVAHSVVRLGQQDGGGRWLDRIKRPVEAMRVRAEDLSGEMARRLGFTMRGGEIEAMPEWAQRMDPDQLSEVLGAITQMEGKTFWRPGDRTDRENREIRVLDKGKPTFWEIKDAALFDLLEGLGTPAAAHLLVKTLGVPGRVLRAGATQYNPAFFISNFQRDLFQALTMTDSDLTRLPDQARARMRGVREALRGGDMYHLFLASGADMSGLFGEYYDPLKARIDFQSLFARRRALGLVKGNSPRQVAGDLVRLGAIDRLNQAFELSNRLGEFTLVYERRKAEGAGEAAAVADAGQAAADITVDFQRGGTWAKQVNEVVPFFNVAIVGTAKLGRFFRDDPVRAFGRVFSLVIAPSLIQLLLNWDNEDYWAKPLHERDRYWYFPTGGDDRGNPTYLKIAKPYGLAAFSIAAERSFGYLLGINPETGEPGGDPGAFRDVGQALLNELRPTLNIAGLQPLLEVNAGAQGYSFYWDNEIVSQADKDLPYHMQGASRSSNLARFLGRMMDYPPAKIDYLIRNWFGGLGDQAAQLIADPALRGADWLLDGSLGTAEGEPVGFEDWMIVRRFLASGTRGGHEAISRFFDDYDRLRRIDRGLAALEPYPDRYDAYARRHRGGIALWGAYSTARRRMGERFASLRRLYRDREMDPDRKEERIDGLYDQITALAREAHQLRNAHQER